MADLTGLLHKEINGLDFFRIIMLLERNSEINNSNSICSSALHLLSDASLAFPPNDIADLTIQNGVITAVLSFMGLCGISSPLPSYFSDLSARDSDNNLNDFLNIFNHRIYYLFYKAWKKYQLSTFLNISGLEYYPSGNNQKDKSENDSKGAQFSPIPYSGILLTKCRSKSALEIILRHYYEGKPIRIEEFVKRKKRLKKLCPLGGSVQLGRNTFLGEEYIDACGNFRIVVGPLNLVNYVNFTADSVNVSLIKKIVNSFISDQLEFDIEVQLQLEDLMPVVLGDSCTKLGETSLLGKCSGQDKIYSIVMR